MKERDNSVKSEGLGEITSALARLGMATIGMLAKETRHGYQTIARHLDQLRKEGRVFPTIPDNLPARLISPGRVMWALLPPEDPTGEIRGEEKPAGDSGWERF